MAQLSPIRTAVLGYGVSGRVFHSPFIATDPAFSLEIISTANESRALTARERYPDVEIVAHPDDVFARAEALDLVVIGTPPSTHYALARAAIEAGLNVVVDKPFVPTSAEGQDLVERAAAAGVVLTVFQNRRWDADFLTLRALIEAGELGEVRTFESRFETWKPNGFRDWKGEATLADGGGILFDLGAHLIDQAIQLFGPAEVMSAETRRHSGATADADEDSFLSLRHPGGVISHLSMSGAAALPAPRFYVKGSRAAYIKWGLDSQEPSLIAGMLPTDPEYGRDAEVQWGTLGTPDGSRIVTPERGDYAEFYRGLAAAIRSDAPLPVDPADSIEVLRLIEEAHRVARA